MKHIPLIVGFGGYNAAGRSSGHNAYQRMIFESLDAPTRAATLASLNGLMGVAELGANLTQQDQEKLLAGTLIRRIEKAHFDVDAVPVGRPGALTASPESPVILTIANKDVPEQLPAGWRIRSRLDGKTEIELSTEQTVQWQSTAPLAVQSAGQLPTGFDPGLYYKSTHHPRGLQLTVMAASDAVHSVGIPWRSIHSKVRPDQVSVYASSVMSQLDGTGLGGMMQSRLRGQRVTSKQLALGLNSMPADFVNAYVLGNFGTTAGVTGACATFAYNLKAAVDDIRSGRCKVALVGSTEAPILPEIIEGYAAMSALATDAELARLDGNGRVDHRRSSRPFGNNCGFTLAESGQFVMLMADQLAIELGARIFGAVPGVFVNADGFKKSISAPGPGNYVTMAKACALASKLAGEECLRHRSFIQAHGSSTPHNRVSESLIFDKMARVFGIDGWPVAAVKAYLGHSLGPASGDQLAASLGVFARGYLPGIKTIDRVADDVPNEKLNIALQDLELGVENAQIALLNSKGFGGNNATAAVFSPFLTDKLLEGRYGRDSRLAYERQRALVDRAGEEYQQRASRGQLDAIYQFGDGLIDDAELNISPTQISHPAFERPIDLLREDL